MPKSPPPSDAETLTRRLLKRVAAMSLDEQRALLEMLETPMGIEQRELPRRLSELVVHYADDRRSYQDPARDISAGGMFIETSEHFAVGDCIRISFRIPGVALPIRLCGKIVRTSPAGIGVKFDWKTPSP